ncbi:MAG TPA: M14 family zinc carboxypeptidase [Actinomycetes bacterium]|nr:M14 family zinc carboxypeptidase [Actinomycetes bacterium]
MSRRSRLVLIVLLQLVALVVPLTSARAEPAPPWCGTPMPDAAENLPDGTDPTDPVGSFPHIPYYAIGCTLEAIRAQSSGRMEVDAVGRSALGRALYLVTINALDTPQQRKDFHSWQEIRKIALTDPAGAKGLLERHGGNVKVPILIQAGIHGNEYEGVDASLQIIEKLATTPYGMDPAVDAILDHAIVLFNVIQNPDGRIAGTRANGNGFDLNRDYLTQSQPETQTSVGIMQEWLAPEVLDLHGYVTPTLVEATTKPHNPSIEYDLWLKWNQSRIDANEAALASVGLDITRPINDWCSNGDEPGPSGICPDGSLPGPAVAEGWDDWGPFYTAMYAQHVGLNASTVEMCNQTDFDCALEGTTLPPDKLGRLGARLAQYTVSWSTLLFDVAHRHDLLFDQMEFYRRGVTNAPRPACCPPPFDEANNWMHEYPTAFVIPMGDGQRSEPEANRLVDWLLTNGVVVEEMKQASTFEGQTFQKGSYVIPMTQARRGLVDTALGIGVDISDEIGQLYAPPAAWSHGYLWGADVTLIPRGAAFSPQTNQVTKSSHLLGGVEPGVAERYALAIDSPTAVRTLNQLVGEGTPAQLATSSFNSATGGVLPAGSVVFPADPATKVRLANAGRVNDVWFHRLSGSSVLPALEPIDRVPRLLVLTRTANQDVWSLRSLGFPTDFMSTTALNNAAADPLPNYDVIWNTGAYPSVANATARSRLQAFFAAGGGYLGAGANGANFLTAGSLVSGLTAASRTGSGRSAIVYWNNRGGADSPIVGAFPSQDTAIMDPPTWFTAVPTIWTVDGQFPGLPWSNIVASGFWKQDAQSASAPDSAVIAHGLNTAGTAGAGTARLTVFAMNPLYRADPERLWSMVGTAAYWADQ